MSDYFTRVILRATGRGNIANPLLTQTLGLTQTIPTQPHLQPPSPRGIMLSQPQHFTNQTSMPPQDVDPPASQDKQPSGLKKN